MKEQKLKILGHNPRIALKSHHIHYPRECTFAFCMSCCNVACCTVHVFVSFHAMQIYHLGLLFFFIFFLKKNMCRESPVSVLFPLMCLINSVRVRSY
jgi:hypothetical protein